MSDFIDSNDSNAGEHGSGSRRRRVELSDLPHEIKGLIARHCRGVDDCFDSVIRSLEGRGGLPADSDCSLDDLRKAYRRTVAVLYEVSKEWRELCAPYRFEPLSTSKVGDDFFHLVIAPKYGHYFVSVTFDITMSPRIIEFIKALPLLPNLDTLSLTNDLFDGIHDLDATLQRAIEEKLTQVIERGVRQLSLRSLSPINVFRLTARARHLTKLSFKTSDSLVLDELWNIVSPMTQLADLHIVFIDISPAEPLRFATLLDNQPETIPELKSLALAGYVTTDDASEFIAIFASSLRRLVVGTQEKALALGKTQSLVPACSFPKLLMLFLRVPNTLLQKTLDDLPGPSQLPNLRYLSTMREAIPLPATSMVRIKKVAAEHTGIKQVACIPYFERVSLVEALGPADPSRLGVRYFEYWYPILAMTNTDALAELLQHDTAREQRQNTLDVIDELLEYATERRKRIATTGDWVDATRFVKDLRRLDLQRRIHLL